MVGTRFEQNDCLTRCTVLLEIDNGWMMFQGGQLVRWVKSLKTLTNRLNRVDRVSLPVWCPRDLPKRWCDKMDDMTHLHNQGVLGFKGFLLLWGSSAHYFSVRYFTIRRFFLFDEMLLVAAKTRARWLSKLNVAGSSLNVVFDGEVLDGFDYLGACFTGGNETDDMSSRIRFEVKLTDLGHL